MYKIWKLRKKKEKARKKFNSENLFGDLPTLYNKYEELVKPKYPPYRPNDNIVKK